MSSTGTGITSRYKITTGVCLKQLDSWLSDFSGKHLYQMALSEPSVCLTCYFPHTQQPAPVKIKGSLTAYHTSCFSDPNRSAPLTQYHTTVSMQSMILKAYYTADMLTFPWTQYSAFSLTLPSLKINPTEDAVSLVGFISITLSIQISVW